VGILKNSDSGTEVFAVIGSSGYIGSKIVKTLEESSCHVIRVSRTQTESDEYSSYVLSELDKLECWLEIVQKADVIIYLAGNTSVTVADQDPLVDMNLSTIPINLLIKACRTLNKKPRVVFASTATIYGFTEQLPVKEDLPANPCTFYDLHKYFVENQLALATQLGFLEGVTLRIANVYGPSFASSSSIDRGIMNKIIALALEGQVITLYGGGNYIRDYVYIDDVVQAFILACVSDRASGEVFNIASGVGTSVKDAFHTVAEEVAVQTNIVVGFKDATWPLGSSKIDIRDFVASIEKATSFLGWIPQKSLSHGVFETVRAINLESAKDKQMRFKL
jgi:UDP-glucose 4-epimerase